MAENDTPLIAQYQSIKAQHANEVLFFRLGDFYEMFGDDAVEVSRLLNLTLTHRADKPMCGIPYHAAKVYIARLLRLGKKIAICEQVGEIAKPGKGLTRREVVEIITPGTAVESEYLDGGRNNFLASFWVHQSQAGFSYIDVTTGDFKATHFSSQDLSEQFAKELGRCMPRELLLPDSLKQNSLVQTVLATQPNLSVSYYPDWNFNVDLAYKKLLEQFKTATLSSFSLTKESPEVPPAAFLLDYLQKTTNASSAHVESITVYNDSQYVMIDDSSRRNLEITYNLRDGSSQFTLLECVDCTCTAMGSRMVRQWLHFPLTDLAAIQSRQNQVQIFFEDRALLKKIRERLDGILDVERLACRIAMDRAHAKDLQALRASLQKWIEVQALLPVQTLDVASAQKIIELIQNAILDDPSTSLTEGHIIKPHWSEELDHWHQVHDNFSEILEQYVEEERNRTGIANLRVKQSGNMGYFIEVTKGKLSKVPEHFIMRRTLVNADRYTTQKLQELEASLNESGTKILELERDLFVQVRNTLKEYVSYLRQTAHEIAYIDVTSSFAQCAAKNNWVRPLVDQSRIFDITQGRHPVVEAHLPGGEFVPNDLLLCQSDDSAAFALITGPNMAGKSTFLRQNALIALLAQTGSYVPATKAHIGIVDRIFCRVGASDNLARGESTFLVEMTETARILHSATDRSLVIMDEVGRGTSTEDGLSIAWAVSEWLLNHIQCKTLFATHYHELTRLEHEHLIQLCMAVDENGNDVVFLRKVIQGASQNSYGIHVARLAGLPSAVVNRARDILAHIQQDADDRPIAALPLSTEKTQQSLTGALFSDEEMILDEILSCDTDNMTPLAALQLVSRWKKSLSGQ
ncbi:MAG TPA: DNA mismatch repair protein MutS [Treponema sp.]|nr:DNA mismatch repair protein MutS [Treponema sp.]